MTITYQHFLDRVIGDGIAAARQSYAGQPDHPAGSLEGFEACRGKNPPELALLLEEARKVAAEAHLRGAPDYWKVRCREAEIEWTCNCVSAALANEGKPPIIPPTARAYLKLAEIVGLSEDGA